MFPSSFLCYLGSSSASSCEERTVNSCWWCRRKWKRTNHGGLMANHRMSVVLRRGRVVADTPLFFCHLGVSFTQPLLELDPEKMQSNEGDFSRRIGESQSDPLGTEDWHFHFCFFIFMFVLYTWNIVEVTSNLGNCFSFLLSTFPEAVQASAGGLCYLWHLWFALVRLPPSLTFTKACPYLCLILIAFTPPLFLSHTACETLQSASLPNMYFHQFPNSSLCLNLQLSEGL